MCRDKKMENKHFDCSKEDELRYLANLYPDSKKVYSFLKQGGENKTIPNYEHKYIFLLIKSVLGFDIPI